ncbi:MAG TPA: TAXI family TRAP transporter solute-binding subunit [Usitatibacter sp.]|nr:TAXI family TRAP transporter solute-binding subunit [Usitatibacter sp.]
MAARTFLLALAATLCMSCTQPIVLKGALVVGNDPVSLSLGTATPGGGFPVYGEAFVSTVHEADPTIRIEARNTRGSAENIPLLEQGKLDLALVQGEAAHEALMGINRDKPTDIKVVWAMYSSPGMFVVRADSPYRTIADLKGKPVAWGAKGSGLVLLGGYVVDALGMDPGRDFQPVYLERAGDGPAMVLDGRVAALWGGGIGWPNFTAVANSPGGARFITPDEEEIGRILLKYKSLKRVTIPAGSYKGIERDTASVGSWSFVFARKDLSGEAAYRLARALHRGQGKMAALLRQGRESTAANTWQAVPDISMLHPGVVRYLRDAQIAK